MKTLPLAISLLQTIEIQKILFLNISFFQIDLATQKSVTGVIIQGGFYEDITGILFDRQESWIPEFAVSYAEYEGRRFQYIMYDGKVQVCL